MAPHAEDPIPSEYFAQPLGGLKLAVAKGRSVHKSNLRSRLSTEKVSARYEPGRVQPLSSEDCPHEDLRPSFPDVHWEPLKEVPYEDRGLLGDPRFQSLLDAAEDVVDYVPKIGTEISGVRLSQLTAAQKNDLARLIATRGVVFFHNQDDFDIEAQRELGRYFGTLHRHATTSMPRKEGLDDVHVIHTTDQSLDQRALFTPTYLWHSDVRHFVIIPTDLLTLVLGHLRGPATIIHITQSTERSSSWRWRRYIVVFSIRYLRYFVCSNAEISREPHGSAFGSGAGRGFACGWPPCSPRPSHDGAPSGSSQSCYRLEISVFQPRLRDQHCRHTESRE